MLRILTTDPENSIAGYLQLFYRLFFNLSTWLNHAFRHSTLCIICWNPHISYIYQAIRKGNKSNSMRTIAGVSRTRMKETREAVRGNPTKHWANIGLCWQSVPRKHLWETVVVSSAPWNDLHEVLSSNVSWKTFLFILLSANNINHHPEFSGRVM